MLLRDPVQGDIYLTENETRVLDTREMQRLRGIKQLGTAHLVFPGCVHTRFDHSLGALAAAHRILEHLRLAGHHIDPQDAELVRLAILVHDVTHIPYGHTFEDEREIFPGMMRARAWTISWAPAPSWAAPLRRSVRWMRCEAFSRAPPDPVDGAGGLQHH